jgi:hypothetical protein
MTPAGALLAILAAAPAPGDADAERQAVERALRQGRVVSVTTLTEGVTRSSRVELRDGTRTVRALFKTADVQAPSRYAFGGETVSFYRDTYHHEVAAYVLDTLLGLGLVPPVVERKIEGRKGSLQAWVERALPRFAPAAPPEDMGRAEERMHAMRLFDYLVFNTDRHVRNVVFTPDWRPVAIDNSIAFHAFLKPYRPLYRFPRGPLERLRALDARALRDALRRHLQKDEIAALQERRTRVLRLADEALAAPAPEPVLFEW